MFSHQKLRRPLYRSESGGGARGVLCQQTTLDSPAKLFLNFAFLNDHTVKTTPKTTPTYGARLWSGERQRVFDVSLRRQPVVPQLRLRPSLEVRLQALGKERPHRETSQRTSEIFFIFDKNRGSKKSPMKVEYKETRRPNPEVEYEELPRIEIGCDRDTIGWQRCVAYPCTRCTRLPKISPYFSPAPPSSVLASLPLSVLLPPLTRTHDKWIDAKVAKGCKHGREKHAHVRTSTRRPTP